LEKAKKHAEANVRIFDKLIDGNTPLIGLEPSAILSFRDEYPRIVSADLVEAAKKLKFHVKLIDEFLGQEVAAGNIKAESFTSQSQKIKLHGHCHQKALSSLNWTQKLLSHSRLTILWKPSQVDAAEWRVVSVMRQSTYDVSQQIGELVLFPAVRNAEAETMIAAPGTSCRHQITDGTGRKAKHPVEILWEALNL
jgi:Fe-S oxidoreductase